MSKFKEFNKEIIEEMKNQFNYSEVLMKGFNNELFELKTAIEKLYDEKIFNMGYGLDEAPYHGWAGEDLKEMREINEEIEKRMLEIYAIILKATDSKIN